MLWMERAALVSLDQTIICYYNKLYQELHPSSKFKVIKDLKFFVNIAIGSEEPYPLIVNDYVSEINKTRGNYYNTILMHKDLFKKMNKDYIAIITRALNLDINPNLPYLGDKEFAMSTLFGFIHLGEPIEVISKLLNYQKYDILLTHNAPFFVEEDNGNFEKILSNKQYQAQIYSILENRYKANAEVFLKENLVDSLIDELRDAAKLTQQSASQNNQRFFKANNRMDTNSQEPARKGCCLIM